MEDALIVGGGIAGLQAAIQLGRGSHRVLVLDAGGGRSSLCRGYHNVLGWPQGVSGEELRRLGREHAEQYGVRFVQDRIMKAKKQGEGFLLTGEAGAEYQGAVLLVATGVMDRFPPLDRLKECLGITVYVCPDCDSYEIRGKRTVVMGAGNVGAKIAMTLHGAASSLVYVNHERKAISEEERRNLKEKGIPVIEEAIREVLVEGDGRFKGVVLQNGERVEGERGFIAFGGNEVRTGLLHQLGAERMESGHVVVDPRTKETKVPGVWAAGDIGVHAEQLTIAMGEGMQAAIWMHKALVARANKEQTVGAT